jgi:hypothetical protein
MGGRNPEEKDWRGNQEHCLPRVTETQRGWGICLLENPESLFADSSRTQKRRGIYFCRRITGNVLAIVPETQKGRGISFCGRIRGHFLAIVPETQKERGISFCGRITGKFLSRVPETYTGRRIFWGKSRVIVCQVYQKPSQEGGFLFGGDSRAIVCRGCQKPRQEGVLFLREKHGSLFAAVDRNPDRKGDFQGNRGPLFAACSRKADKKKALWGIPGHCLVRVPKTQTVWGICGGIMGNGWQ